MPQNSQPDRGKLSLQLHFVDEVDEVLLAVDVQLAIDVADVGLRRALGDVELLLDVGGVAAAGCEMTCSRGPGST